MPELVVNIVQIVVATVLFFVMMFGIGFILNMLLKTTWFPVVLFFIVLIGLAIWSPWDPSENPSMDNIGTYTLVYYIPITGALIGAFVSGWAIRALRRGGYKMF
ncbi:YuiB family protein [Paenibacillus sp. J5C_2022]|uniref:YuiB family protein n=1 Tax=Paenibacillus sp. J5C2022 TaxID=2977129 RepID=UPI0021CDFEBF|nr:YuiB family protein [Paenibacillus sp. J5C2022]MCU6709836.1 YuiB family protein [Paenibacillus sp. J5C2022]